MFVGLLTLELHIAEARSLKDKRQILRSLKDRLRRKFNVAVAELDFQDVWQKPSAFWARYWSTTRSICCSGARSLIPHSRAAL